MFSSKLSFPNGIAEACNDKLDDEVGDHAPIANALEPEALYGRLVGITCDPIHKKHSKVQASAEYQNHRLAEAHSWVSHEGDPDGDCLEKALLDRESHHLEDANDDVGVDAILDIFSHRSS